MTHSRTVSGYVTYHKGADLTRETAMKSEKGLRILLKALTRILATASIAFALAVQASATAINEKYTQLGGASGLLGAPTIVESTAPDGVGRYRHYQGGSIYWHPHTGAHEVHGLIRQKWAGLGWEKSQLGYPISDELVAFDGAGRVSKFQRGQLFWSATTNQVTSLFSTDLIVDLPFAVGEVWRINQANGVKPDDSHQGQWVYAWDFEIASPSTSAIVRGLAPVLTLGHPFHSAADGRIVWVLDHFQAGDGDDNRIAIRLDEGRYASYLHALKGSYHKRSGTASASGGISLTPQALPWDSRPTAVGGTVLAETGNVCEDSCGPHLHFSVTTKPDIKTFSPFETLPVSFRNYSVSTDSGKTWTYVPTGTPKTGEWIRREATAGGTTGPVVQSSRTPIRHGAISGNIMFKSGNGFPAGAGMITVIAIAPWGEPLATTEIPVYPRTPGQLTYQLENVPAFGGLRVAASYQGPWSVPTGGGPISGQTTIFDLTPNGSAVANVSLEATVIH